MRRRRRRTIPFLAMLHQVAEVAARLDDVGRQAEHVDVAPVAGDDARRCVIQHQALRSCCSGRCRAAAFSASSRCCASRFCRLICRMIRNRISAITSADSMARGDHGAGLCAPVGQRGAKPSWSRRRRSGSGCSGRRGAEPVLAVDRALHAQRLLAALGQRHAAAAARS